MPPAGVSGQRRRGSEPHARQVRRGEGPCRGDAMGGEALRHTLLEGPHGAMMFATDPDGTPRLTLISDDNLSILQRNLLLEFRLVGPEK